MDRREPVMYGSAFTRCCSPLPSHQTQPTRGWTVEYNPSNKPLVRACCLYYICVAKGKCRPQAQKGKKRKSAFARAAQERCQMNYPALNKCCIKGLELQNTPRSLHITSGDISCICSDDDDDNDDKDCGGAAGSGGSAAFA